MSKLILILSLCTFPFVLLGQEDSIESTEKNSVLIPRFEIGINATDFIQRLISFNDLLIEDPNAYLLTAKYLINHKRALRIGLNASFNDAEQGQILNPGSSQGLTSYSFDTRLGFLMNRRISNRWSAYFGIDAIYSLDHVETIIFNGFETTKLSTDRSTLGGGPAIGVQFFLNSKISISTELLIYFKYNETQSSQDGNGNGAPDVVNTSTANNATIAAPASLYFNFRF